MPDKSIWDKKTPAEKIIEMADKPLKTTGKPPSPESVAAALLTATRAQSLPEPIAEESDEELPPEPTFLVIRDAYGPGAHSVKFADGTPVGVWSRDSGMNGEAVEQTLLDLGLDQDIAAFFRRTREGAIAARQKLAQHPSVRVLAATEAERDARMKDVRAAFIKAKGSKL